MSKFYLLFVAFLSLSMNFAFANPLDSCDLSISVSPQNICRGDSLGAVFYKIRKGVPPYEIYTSFNNKDSLVVGEYYILVTDSLGCSDSVHFEIFKPKPFDASIQLYNSGCGESTICGEVGSIEQNGFYQYSWSNGFSGRCLDIYDIGTWDLDVADVYGCTEHVSITLDTTQISSIHIGYFPNLMIPYCQDSLELTSQVYGNIEGVQYDWAGPNNFSSTQSSVFVSDTGSYSLVVTNAKGCSDIENFMVGKRVIKVTPSFKQQKCTNKVTNVFFEINGAKGPYTIDYPLLSTLTDSLPVTITDSEGCVFMKTFALPDQTPFSSFINPIDELNCSNDSVIICPTVINGTPPYSFSWTNAGGSIIGDSSCAIITSFGEYEVEIIDSVGCTTHETYSVANNTGNPNNISIDPERLVLTCAYPVVTLCANFTNCDSCAIVWTTSDGHFIGNPDSICIEVDAQGLYTLMLTNLSNGCSSFTSFSIIEDVSIPYFEFPQEEITIKHGECVDLTYNTTLPNTEGIWTDTYGVSIGSNPTVCDSGVYTLVVTNLDNGCTNQGSIIVDFTTANFNLDNHSIQIKPNPTSDLIHIEFEKKLKGNISIISLQGQILKNQKIEGLTLNFNLKDFSKGVYFLKIESDMGIFYEKILKQ